MCCAHEKPGKSANRDDLEKPHGSDRKAKPCCAKCAEKHAPTSSRDTIVLAPQSVPEVVHRALHAPGVTIDSRTRRAMEAHFQRDLGDIRIHIDSRAAESAEAIGALAYAFGKHIVFGPGLYLPDEPAGRRILVHELTHCLQQAASWNRPCVWPETMFESANAAFEDEAEALALAAVHGSATSTRLASRISAAPLQLACLGANPNCTQGQRELIHQAIFNANAWVNNAMKKFTATPTPAIVRSALRRNFGNTYGVTANLQLFIERIRRARSVMNRIPMGCNSTAPKCVARHCGFAEGAGSMAVTICTVTLEAGVDARMPARCVLHESFHAAFTRFTVDSYSTGHGTSEATAGYPGAGVDPLLNADSYTTLVMDLS